MLFAFLLSRLAARRLQCRCGILLQLFTHLSAGLSASTVRGLKERPPPLAPRNAAKRIGELVLTSYVTYREVSVN